MNHYSRYKLKFDEELNLYGAFYELFLDELLIDSGQFGIKDPYCTI